LHSVSILVIFLQMSLFIIHYHEIGLKGGNRSFFESRLKNNLQRSLNAIKSAKITKKHDHFRVECLKHDAQAVKEKLQLVFGIEYFAEVTTVKPDLKSVIKESIGFLENELGHYQDVRNSAKKISFRVEVHRADKNFFMNSVDLAKAISAQILSQFQSLKVDLSGAQLVLRVVWGRDEVHLYLTKHPGSGGLPVGSAGKVVSLISSGFDSPVASWMMMRRGATVVFVHFHSYPAVGPESIENVKSIISVLNNFQFQSKLYLLPLLEYQKIVVAKAPAPLRVLLYRRMMIRLAERVLYREKAKALVTGESLGQVASQTLDNIHGVDILAHRPVFRPLIGINKQEIIRMAEKIGTAVISAQPYEECCSLYVPRSPVLSVKIEDLEKAEEYLQIDSCVEILWSKREVVNLQA